MTQSKRAGAVQAIVRGRLPEIRAWQADGVSGHTIAGRLGIAESSYRDALKAVAAETQQPGPSVNVDVRQPVSTHALVPLVHDGAPVPLDERASTLIPSIQEVAALLPTLRQVHQMLPTIKVLASRRSEHQALEQMPEDYQKFIATYSVRLSPALIETIKAYAKSHRLSQSEVATTAFYELLSRE